MLDGKDGEMTTPPSTPDAPPPSPADPAAAADPAAPVLTPEVSAVVQGLGLAGFRKDYQHVMCLTLRDAASGQALIGKLAPLIATDAEVAHFNRLFSGIRKRRGSDSLSEQAVTATWIGIGISAFGLAKLGVLVTDELPAGDGMNAFVAGMAARAQQIGDIGGDDPSTWRPGISQSDVILILASDTSDGLGKTTRELEDLVSSYGAVITYAESGQTLPGRMRGHEHFGFKDGSSQPDIVGYTAPAPAGAPGAVAIGEFLLGYPDQAGPAAQVGPHFLNGSQLVFRRLHQDVVGFTAQAAATATAVSPAISADLAAAKMVGRWPSDAPLEGNPDTDPGSDGVTNAFAFSSPDADGHVVPQCAHIRKVNPRDESQPAPAQDPQRHRMIRRGIPYTSDHLEDGPDRGLHFLAVVADVNRQFEFVQHQWSDDPNFPNGGTPATNGGYSPPEPGTPAAGPDAVSGHYPDGALDAYVPAAGAAAQTVPLSHQLVRMTGGEYYLLPSITALDLIATPPASPSTPPASTQ